MFFFFLFRPLFFLTVSLPFSVGSSCHGRHLVWVQKTDMVDKSLLPGWLLVRLPFTVPTTAKSQLQLEYTQEDPQNKPPLYSHSCLKDGQCYSASSLSTKTLSWYHQCWNTRGGCPFLKLLSDSLARADDFIM